MSVAVPPTAPGFVPKTLRGLKPPVELDPAEIARREHAARAEFERVFARQTTVVDDAEVYRWTDVGSSRPLHEVAVYLGDVLVNTHPVEPGVWYTVGRGPHCSIQIPAYVVEVSRHHAAFLIDRNGRIDWHDHSRHGSYAAVEPDATGAEPHWIKGQLASARPLAATDSVALGQALGLGAMVTIEVTQVIDVTATHPRRPAVARPALALTA